MKQCQFCGQKLKDSANFCVKCGRPIPKDQISASVEPHNTGRLCPACGKLNAPQTKFCIYCGAGLAGKQPVPSSPPRKKASWLLPVGIILIIMLAIAAGISIFSLIQQQAHSGDRLQEETELEPSLEEQKDTSPAPSEWEKEEMSEEAEQAEKSISIRPGSVVLTEGERVSLSIAEGDSVSWTVENPDLVGLSATSGDSVEVEALQPGHTTVTASSGELTAQCEVVILQSEQSERNEGATANENQERTEQQENGYILPTDSRLIEESELYGMSQEEVALARNEIYARHGHIFTTEAYADYFEQQSWYTPNPNFDSMDPTQLTEIERKNIDVIVGYEEKMGWR